MKTGSVGQDASTNRGIFHVYKAAVTADVGRSQKADFVPRASENDRRP
jgi:hypothetical protein